MFADDPPHRDAAARSTRSSAYSDNAAVMEGGAVERWLPRGLHQRAGVRGARARPSHVLMKVETHNHPTAISPFPGAATGAGGEIRDEGATGRGAQPEGRPHRLHRVEPAPARHRRAVGAATLRQARAHRQRAADHDRGPARRRRLQQRVRPAQPARLLPRLRADGRPACSRGYHKPIMIAGGLGHDRARRRRTRSQFPAGTLLIQLGGPGMRIGMGGGAASSMAAGSQRRRARLRLGAARQPRDPAPRAGGHQPLLAAGRGQPDPRDPRRRRRRPHQRVPRAGRRRRPRRPLRPARGAARGDRPGAEGDLVQREPGALRARARAASRCRCSTRSASASAARSRWSASATDERELVLEDGPRRRARRSTCRWTCCSASRRRCTATCSRVARTCAAARPRPASTLADAPRSTCCATRRWPASAS